MIKTITFTYDDEKGMHPDFLAFGLAAIMLDYQADIDDAEKDPKGLVEGEPDNWKHWMNDCRDLSRQLVKQVPYTADIFESDNINLNKPDHE